MFTFLFYVAHLLLLLGVVGAPLPLISHLLSRYYVCPSAPRSLSHMGLAALALWVVVESLVVTSLGLLGHLWILNLVVIEGALLLAGVWLLTRDHANAASAFWCAMSRHALGLSERPAVERWLLALAGGTLVLLFAQEMWVPIARGDSLMYQLPRVVEWYQHGTFSEPLPAVGDAINRYPFAWNTMFFLALAPMGHDQFILVPNLVAWMMLGLGTYGIARLGGGSSGGGLSWAVLLLLMPLSLTNVNTAHNDLALGALFLASVYFSIQAWQERDGCSMFLVGACVGMMVGSKMTGVGYAGLLIALWLWLLLLSWRTRRPPFALVATVRDHPLMLALAMASIAILGSSWYLRNALETGNPFGSFQVRLLGRVIFDGDFTKTFIDQTSLLSNFRPSDPQHWSILADALRHFPGLPGLLALAAAVVCAPFALLHRSDRRPILLTVLGLCLASLYMYIAGPWSAKQPSDADISGWMGQQMRYSFPFWGLLAAIAGATIRLRFAPGMTLVMGTAMSVSAVDALRHSRLFLEVYPRRSSALFMCAVGLSFLVTMPALHRLARSASIQLMAWRWQWLGLVLMAGIVLVLPLLLLTANATFVAVRSRQSMQNSLYGGIARFVDDLPEDSRIGFWGTQMPYLLYGKSLRRRLHYLALDVQPTREQMLAYLCADRVDVLAVGPQYEASPVWEWLTELERGLQRIHGDDIRHVFLVYKCRGPLPSASLIGGLELGPESVDVAR